jgi:RNA polymerase sigma factor (sigma-70 family)
MIKKLKNYKWLLDNIKYLESDIERIEEDIKKHKKRNFPKELLEKIKRIDNKKLNEAVEKALKRDNSRMVIDTLNISLNNRVNTLLDSYKKAEEIEKFIESLPEKQRKILRMRYQFDLNWNEIAEEMKYSESHVKRLHKNIFERARANG